jgi:hypothetical protein
MHWPQITVICLYAASVTRGIIKHGQSDGDVNAFASIIGAAVSVGLLWAGGFFGGR